MRNKKLLFVFILFCISFMESCKQNDVVFSPLVPYTVQLNHSDYCYKNSDVLSGKIIIDTNNMVAGTNIKKIECRLGNIVIATVDYQMECPFSVELKNKPLGNHILSVIIKCESPGCDETFQRNDNITIEIKE